MEDPNLVLTITAFDVLAGQALGLSHNRPYLSRPSPVVEDAASISSRETTPFPGSYQAPNALHLSLDDRLKDIQSGWVFGSDPELCDILLSSKRKGHGISKRHFSITFDEQRRLVMNDISTHGSRVSYSGQGQEEIRHGFTWILFDDWNIQIHIHKDDFIFNLKLASHDTCENEFRNRISSLLEARENAAPPLDLLRIRSQVSTAPPTQPLSPRKRPIYILVRKLGEGAFGSVYEAKDVSTGETYAAKQFGKSIGFELEVDILRRISHKHVVEYVDITEGPSPLLVMEYMKLGDLHHLHGPLCPHEAELLLQQSLEALDYLHELNITHRDIKPENILIRGRRREFHIKLADFGLSKDVLSLKTWCGTGPYAAPEIWKSHARPTSYTNKVDVWSLGVVMLEVYRVIRIDAHSAGLRWCQTIARTMDDVVRGSPDTPMFLLADMLQLDHCDRMSSKECLQRFHEMDLGGLDWSDSDTEHETDSGIDRVTATEGAPSQYDIADDTSDTGSKTPRAKPSQGLGTSELGHSRRKSPPDPQSQRKTKRRRSPPTSSPRRFLQESRIKRRQAQTDLGTASIRRKSVLPGPLWQVKDGFGEFKTTEADVFALLQDLHQGKRSDRSQDDQPPSLVASICEHLARLKIDFLKVHGSNDKNGVTITAVSETRRFVLGNLAVSELSNALEDLALCLLLLLLLHSPRGSYSNGALRNDSLSHAPSTLRSLRPQAKHSASSRSKAVQVDPSMNTSQRASPV